ncbi:MAG: hypothetical protein O9301_04545 [Leptospira sp.]|nr:hypothetical protein [Leptospira sp.]
MSLIVLGQIQIYGEDLKRVVAWKPIREASGYQIQIKDKKGNRVVDKQIEKSFYSVEDLPTGDYEVRTAPLNLFKKPVVWSNWRELEIIISEPPKVTIEERKPAILIEKKDEALSNQNDSKTKPQTIAIKGDNFLDVTEVEIKKESYKIPILEKDTISKQQIDVKIETKGAKPGDYDLTVTNPYQKPKVISNFLKIENANTEKSATKKEDTVEDQAALVESKKTESQKDSDTPSKKESSLPAGKPLNDYSYEEMMKFLESNVAENCKQTKIPAITLGECNKTFVTVNESTLLNKNIFAFYKLIGTNSSDRMSAYKHFGENCKPGFRPAKEKMDELWKNKNNLEPEERQFLGNSLQKITNCP